MNTQNYQKVDERSSRAHYWSSLGKQILWFPTTQWSLQSMTLAECWLRGTGTSRCSWSATRLWTTFLPFKLVRLSGYHGLKTVCQGFQCPNLDVSRLLWMGSAPTPLSRAPSLTSLRVGLVPKRVGNTRSNDWNTAEKRAKYSSGGKTITRIMGDFTVM
jgi:hypothetical protein